MTTQSTIIAMALVISCSAGGCIDAKALTSAGVGYRLTAYVPINPNMVPAANVVSYCESSTDADVNSYCNRLRRAAEVARANGDDGAADTMDQILTAPVSTQQHLNMLLAIDVDETLSDITRDAAAEVIAVFPSTNQ